MIVFGAIDYAAAVAKIGSSGLSRDGLRCPPAVCDA